MIRTCVKKEKVRKGGDYRFSERPKRPLRGSGGSSGDDPPAKFFEWGY